MTVDGATFRGVVANMPTAFTADGTAVDAARMRAQVDWLLDEGVHGISCLLTTGAFTYLDADERTAVVRCVVDAVDGRVPVVAGVSADTTQQTIALAAAAGDVGADAVLVQPRSYVPLLPDEVLAHFEAVADAVEVPIGVYNHAPSTGVDISPEQHVEIVRRTGAVLAKDSSVGLTNVRQILRACDGPYGYLWANDALLIPALVLGAPGSCTGLASVFPRETVGIHDAVLRGDLDTARREADRMSGVIREMQSIGSPRATKAVGELRGRSYGGHRRPLTDLPADATERLRRAIEQAGIERP